MSEEPATKREVRCVAAVSVVVGLAANWWLHHYDLMREARESPSIISEGGNAEVIVNPSRWDQLRDELATKHPDAVRKAVNDGL